MRDIQTRWALWWEQTPGPRQTLENICQTLLGPGALWIQGRPAWPEELHRLVRSHLSETDSSVNLEFIRGEEGAAPEEAVFSLVPDRRLDYLPAMKLWEFLDSRRILTYTILWVSGLDDPELAAPWLELSGQLARRKAGFRVVCEGAACGGVSKNVRTVSAGTASEFDLLLFAMMNLPESAEDAELKVYLCRLACSAAGNDPERIAALVSDPEFPQDPEGRIAALVPACGDSQRNYAVWKAQIQTVYPAIEQLQQLLIPRYGREIQRVLPYTDDWGNVIRTPDDMELRHLVHCEEQRGLVLPPAAHQTVRLLYRLRNLLAHRRTVSPEDLRQLFSQLKQYSAS